MQLKKPAQKKAFWGWAWWAPPVVLAVGAVAFHAWTSIQIRYNDYEIAQYRRQMEALNAEMREVKVQLAEREEMSTVNVTADELGLQSPKPSQIVRLAFNPSVYETSMPQVDSPVAAPVEGSPRRPQPAMEFAEAAPGRAVAPRETGRLTIARDMDAPLAVVDAPLAAAPAETATELDGSLEDMLEKF